MVGHEVAGDRRSVQATSNDRNRMVVAVAESSMTKISLVEQVRLMDVKIHTDCKAMRVVAAHVAAASMKKINSEWILTI